MLFAAAAATAVARRIVVTATAVDGVTVIDVALLLLLLLRRGRQRRRTAAFEGALLTAFPEYGEQRGPAGRVGELKSVAGRVARGQAREDGLFVLCFDGCMSVSRGNG